MFGEGLQVYLLICYSWANLLLKIVLVCFLLLNSLVFYISELSEDEAEERLQEAIQERFAVFGDVWIENPVNLASLGPCFNLVSF